MSQRFFHPSFGLSDHATVLVSPKNREKSVNSTKYVFKRDTRASRKAELGRYFRATASKYGESHDSSENSDFFFYGVKKTLLVNYFQKYTFKVPASLHFCEIWESSKYSSINQDGRWNLSIIVHFQHASTERRELAWISYSHSL